MDHDACTATFFTPSLWKQRRHFILDTLKKHKVKKVLDYGCGEGAVLSFLIPPSATDDIHFTHLIGLDIDRGLLEQETLAACQPWPSDYKQLRESPLTVDIYCGSVGDYDARLKASQCDAIICSEVIEHVYPSTLQACLPVMLGDYGPPLVIITTPNAEYNVFFPDLNYGQPDATMRHDDHKFEWTRLEFETWCKNGAQQYGYNVEFHGIGLLDGKRDQLAYGHCTQACVFTKQTPSTNQPGSSDTPHTLLKRFEFPYYDLPPLPVDDIFRQVEHYISNLCQAITLQQHEKQVEQQQRTARQQRQDDDDDALDALWSRVYGDDDTKGIDWNCTTNNQAWCTGYIHDDASGNKEDDLWEEDDSSNGTMLSDTKDEPLWTITPITLDIDTLWSILHIRQLCKTSQRLVEEVLPIGGDASYKVMGDQLVVHKSFMVKDEGTG